jgi:hypothetical protein
MKAVKGYYDGKTIQLLEPLQARKGQEVVVVVSGEYKNSKRSHSSKQLRGSVKGLRLTEKLLKSRREDIEREEEHNKIAGILYPFAKNHITRKQS